MIRNYVPFVKAETAADKRKNAPKANVKKVPAKTTEAEPKDYMQKQEEKADKPMEEPKESEHEKVRKQFLMLVPLCTPEQVGVLFLLTQKHNEEALTYDEKGNVSISMDEVTDQMLGRLMDQMDMWGIGFAPARKK